ncbi:ganglioside-induced differentiation-associated protein 1-like [Amphiura filiformis]|uniref:ganglioside-induced differentiation-associated protein 1-like n=1 Tax=Amphiura filiformis TaxID=82378 RepID=UPI003B21519A
MALTLYYNPASFFSQRARLAVEEKGVAYRSHIISHPSGEAIEPWYMRIQPKGTVPALKHGEIIKTDSKDIILYLDEITPDAPKFYPDSRIHGSDRVAYLTDLMQTISVEQISFGSLCYRQYTQDCKLPNRFDVKYAKQSFDAMGDKMRKLAEKHPDLRDSYMDKIKVHEGRDLTNKENFLVALKECDSIMEEIEEELAQKWNGKFDNFTDSDPWLCCDHFTIADIYLATLLHRFVLAGQVKRMWSDGKRPYLAAYYARVQQRKSFQRACGSANNLYLSVLLPKLKHQIRKAFPRLMGFSVFAASLGLAVYVQYKGYPSWWHNNLKLKF